MPDHRREGKYPHHDSKLMAIAVNPVHNIYSLNAKSGKILNLRHMLGHNIINHYDRNEAGRKMESVATATSILPRSIVLVGLMGAGKSKIGRLLAASLAVPLLTVTMLWWPVPV